MWLVCIYVTSHRMCLRCVSGVRGHINIHLRGHITHTHTHTHTHREREITSEVTSTYIDMSDDVHHIHTWSNPICNLCVYMWSYVYICLHVYVYTNVWGWVLLISIPTSITCCTANCLWRVISPLSKLHRIYSSVRFFRHVPLKRDQSDWGCKIRLN